MNSKFTPKLTREINGGVQHVFKLDNGYGASVVQHSFSYGDEEGLWELAILTFSGEMDYELCYDTEITNDVLGRLTEEEVEETLVKINQLEAV